MEKAEQWRSGTRTPSHQKKKILNWLKKHFAEIFSNVSNNTQIPVRKLTEVIDTMLSYVYSHSDKDMNYSLPRWTTYNRCQNNRTVPGWDWGVGRPGRLEVNVNHFRTRRQSSAGVCPTRAHSLWVWIGFAPTSSCYRLLRWVTKQLMHDPLQQNSQ